MKYIPLEMGQRFSRLAVIERIPATSKWRCKCDCGTIMVAYSGNLRKGRTQSCGCLKREGWVHGKSYSPEYRAWIAMRVRCSNPSNKRFKDYGGRGITVCERWAQFENFFSDMGAKPTSTHSIDRINNNGNYEPLNCRWATPKEQRDNRRCTRKAH